MQIILWNLETDERSCIYNSEKIRGCETLPKYVCGATGIKDKEKQSYMFSSF